MASSQKHKKSASTNARQRAQESENLAETPRIRSGQRVSPERFPNETPLTVEDRPSSGRGVKQHGYREDSQPTRMRVKRDTTPDLSAPRTKRRPQRTRETGAPNERR
jgi:hypothetical protein